MAKKIIILERSGHARDLLRAVFWASVPTGRESIWANAAFESQYKGADALELTALRAGTVAEKLYEVEFTPGTTGAETRTDLINAFTQFQQLVNNYNPRVSYGTFWDGITWTVAGVS